jgi:curved DNA-binding protein CbpA
MANGHVDAYAVLGVAPTASQAEITHAYRRQLRALHPDTRSSAGEAAADERLQQVVAAYTLLRDPARRAEYDRDAGIRRERGASRTRTTGPAYTGSPGAVRIPVRHGRSAPHSGDRVRPPVWVRPVRRST